MNASEFNALLLGSNPRQWSDENRNSFLEFLPEIDPVPDPEDGQTGNAIHVARSMLDFKYFASKTMEYGWELKRNPATGVEQYYGFLFGDPDWPGHDQMADFLLLGGERSQLLAPRGCYKTTMKSLYVIWRIGLNPSIRIMYSMDVLKNARKVISSMMLEMERVNYIEIFGRMRPPRGTPGWTVAGLRVVQCIRTSKEPTITPGGIDSALTGDHQDLIILDDIVTEINTRSREMMIKTYEWTKNLEPILDPGCRVIDTGTRWHHADAHGMIQKENENIEDENLKWKILILSAEKENGEPYFRHLDESKLKAARGKGSYFYSCQYLNRPVSDEDQLFFPEQFKLISFDNIPRTTHRYLLMDSATTDSSKSSRTAIWCVAVDMIGNVYCVDLQIGTWKPDLVLRNLYGMWMRWKPRWVTMEANVHGKVYKSYIQAENRIRQTYLKIREIYGRKDRSKHDRIVALQPKFEHGEFYFANSLPEEMIHDDGGKAAGEIVDEFTQFPKGFRDDIPDALADVIAVDKEGKVCPRYTRRPGFDPIIQDQAPKLTTVTGAYPADVQQNVQAPEGRFRGRPSAGGNRWRGRPTSRKSRGRKSL